MAKASDVERRRCQWRRSASRGPHGHRFASRHPHGRRCGRRRATDRPAGRSGAGQEGHGRKGGAPKAPEPVIGPGRPPRKTQWKKGGPSPNPRGRPRKDRTLLPDVKKAFEQALNKKVSVPRGGRQVLMTRLEIGFEQLLNQFAKGDRHARRDLMDYADKLGVDLSGKQAGQSREALDPSHQAILDAYFARRSAPEQSSRRSRGNWPRPSCWTMMPRRIVPPSRKRRLRRRSNPRSCMPTPIPGTNIPNRRSR